MPAGFHYDQPFLAERELCDQSTIYRLAGGFNLDDDKLPAGTKITHLTPITVDFTTRKVKAVKNVKVVEAANSGATSLKVQKGSLIYVGAFLGTGASGMTVSAINTTTSTDYDVLTVTATTENISKGAVLFEASAADGKTPLRTANFLNYAWNVKVEPGATVTAVGRAYSIEEGRLYHPVSARDKESLTSRFFFV
jgi:hypothetical protein